MQTNRRIFITGLILISLAILAALGFWQSVKLDGPVFFEHFRENTIIVGTTPEGHPLYQQVTLQMPFVTDAADQRVIERLAFPGVPRLEADKVRVYYEPGPSLFSFVGAQGQSEGKTMGRYKFNTLMVTLDFLESQPFGPEKLTYADLYYTNGERDRVTIGEIYLSGIEMKERHFEHKSSGGSSDNTHESTFSVESPIEVVELRSPLMTQLEGLYEISINGKSAEALKGEKLSPGDLVHTTATFKAPQDIRQQLTVYDLIPTLDYVAADGEIYSQRLLSIREYQGIYSQVGFLDLVRYLKAKGVI